MLERAWDRGVLCPRSTPEDTDHRHPVRACDRGGAKDKCGPSEQSLLRQECGAFTPAVQTLWHGGAVRTCICQHLPVPSSAAVTQDQSRIIKKGGAAVQTDSIWVLEVPWDAIMEKKNPEMCLRSYCWRLWSWWASSLSVNAGCICSHCLMRSRLTWIAWTPWDTLSHVQMRYTYTDGPRTYLF